MQTGRKDHWPRTLLSPGCFSELLLNHRNSACPVLPRGTHNKTGVGMLCSLSRGMSSFLRQPGPELGIETSYGRVLD